MKKCLALIFVAFTIHPDSFAQYSRYIIKLKDKAGSPYTTGDPLQYLTQRSIDRRARYNIAINATDLPVNAQYIDSIRLSGTVSILNISKWLNQVCIQTTDAGALARINSFPFVVASAPVAARPQPSISSDKERVPANKPSDNALRPQSPADAYNYGLAWPQVHLHNGEFLHNQGFKGQGMQLAIMDAGFFHYKTLPTFDSIRNNNQVLGTWDFVANEESVDEDNAHGMNCFSTIAANLPGSFVGTSPGSSYYLYRTEDASSEYPVEEQNFAAAAERADSLGVDIFSISLGYNTFSDNRFDYTYADMDGNTTIITRACDYAAQKGILVVAAAGNEGNGNWRYLTAPADADSVLAVGAVSTERQVAGFSSYGPTSDGRIKPDVAAVGQGAVVANQLSGEPSYSNGTSFACPIMAGISTCLWQAFPEVNNMAIIDALRNSSDKVNMPGDRVGYGIPDAKKAFVGLIKKLYTQQVTLENACKAVISWTVKSGAGMSLVIERKLPAGPGYTAINTQQFSGDFTSRNFSYTDDLSALPAGVTVWYRLRMNISADTSFYLDSSSVNYIAPCANISEKIVISPNPARDYINVLVTRNDPVRVSVVVHAATGKLVYRSAQQAALVTSFTIPLKQLSKGVYFVSVYFDDRKQLVKKVIRL